MSEDLILKCLIAFIIGFLVERMMRGDGLSVGAVEAVDCDCDNGTGYTVNDLINYNQQADLLNPKEKGKDYIDLTYCATEQQLCKSCNDGYRLKGLTGPCENKCQCSHGTPFNAGPECHFYIQSLQKINKNKCSDYSNCNVCSSCDEGYKLNHLRECIPICKEDEYLNESQGFPVCQPKDPKGPIFDWN